MRKAGLALVAVAVALVPGQAIAQDRMPSQGVDAAERSLGVDLKRAEKAERVEARRHPSQRRAIRQLRNAHNQLVTAHNALVGQFNALQGVVLNCFRTANVTQYDGYWWGPGGDFETALDFTEAGDFPNVRMVTFVC